MPNQYITLKNGVKMPQLGLGVWMAESGQETENNVTWALKAGYRHIDTAFIYKNEDSVGKAVRASGIPREEIFVTTKLWNSEQGYEKTLAAFERSRQTLGLDYVDLYLIHWPGPNKESYLETWKAFEKLYKEKKVRAIGVSNFEPEHLDELLRVCEVKPMVNQVELHPRLQQERLREYCRANEIAITGWRPLGKGDLLIVPEIVEIAKKHNKTPAQVLIRWNLDNDIIVIPKSSNENRIKENFDVFDFTLDSDDLQKIKTLNKNERYGGDPKTFFPC